MMTNSRNQSPENRKVPFCESESLQENVNRCLRTFYLSHHELLMNEFSRVLNEKCGGCQMNDRNQFAHELCLLASVQEQVNICFEEAYNRVNWDQVFELCQEKLRNTYSYGVCSFLPVASAEKDTKRQKHTTQRHESTKRQIQKVDERITHHTIHVYELLQTSVILGYINCVCLT